MIKTAYVYYVDLINGNVRAVDNNGIEYWTNYLNMPIPRVPNIGDKIVLAVENTNAYIIGFINEQQNYDNNLKAFREIRYKIDENNFMHLLKNVFEIILSNSNFKINDNNIQFNTDAIQIFADNGYLIIEKDKIEINYKQINNAGIIELEATIKINKEDGIVLKINKSNLFNCEIKINEKIEINANNESKIELLNNGVINIDANVINIDKIVYFKDIKKTIQRIFQWLQELKIAYNSHTHIVDNKPTTPPTPTLSEL